MMIGAVHLRDNEKEEGRGRGRRRSKERSASASASVAAATDNNDTMLHATERTSLLVSSSSSSSSSLPFLLSTSSASSSKSITSVNTDTDTDMDTDTDTDTATTTTASTAICCSLCESCEIYTIPEHNTNDEDDDNNNNNNNDNTSNTNTRKEETLRWKTRQPPTAAGAAAALTYHLQELRASSTMNIGLAIYCLIYLGINIALLNVNYIKWQQNIEENEHTDNTDHNNENNENTDNDDDGEISDLAFHLVEFWATFGFAVAELLALVYIPQQRRYSYNNTNTTNMDTITPRTQNQGFLRLVMVLNIVGTIIPAVMVTFSLEIFEVVSHEIEYTNELAMAGIDMIIAVSLYNNNNNNNNNNSRGRRSSIWTTTLVAEGVAIIQLGVYNLLGHNEETGEMKYVYNT